MLHSSVENPPFTLTNFEPELNVQLLVQDLPVGRLLSVQGHDSAVPGLLSYPINLNTLNPTWPYKIFLYGFLI